MSSEWQPPRSAFPPLQIAVVHLDEPSAAALDSELNLSPFELSLARCLAGPLAASRYRRARAALRVLLARVSGVKPVELVLNGASGRLAAAEGGELRYSLSMSGHLAAIALSADREVGVRAAVQQMAFPRGFAAALRSLRAGEQLAVLDLPPQGREDALRRLLTLRGAFAECAGADQASLLDATPFLSGVQSIQCGRWTVQAVPAPPGCSVALAASGTGWGYQLVSPLFEF